MPLPGQGLPQPLLETLIKLTLVAQDEGQMLFQPLPDFFGRTIVKRQTQNLSGDSNPLASM